MKSQKNFKNNQQEAWESEYRNPRFLTLGQDPTAEVVRFSKWLRKKFKNDWRANGEKGKKRDIEDLSVLDLGCGTGRNAFYFAERGARVIGYDISKTAINIANQRAGDLKNEAKFYVHDMAKPYDLPNQSIDLILDTTSSHVLSKAEREIYLSESARVLKDDGLMLVRLLTKDGDENAKKLLKQYPGPEEGAYILPGLGIVERVATGQEIEEEYSQYFKIEFSEKKVHYATFGDKKFKRSYRVLYLSMKPRLKSA